MPEVTNSVVANAATAGLGAAAGAGLLGGIVMVLLDPPKTRRQMFGQSVVAGVGSIVFGPIAVQLIDYYSDAIDLSRADWTQVLEVAAPICFVIGSLSWGVAAALVHLRHMIADRGAEVVADRLGVGPVADAQGQQPPKDPPPGAQ